MKYKVTLPDGRTRTRNSQRVYTHALACRKGDRWGVLSFCGSLALATKAQATWIRSNPKIREQDRFDEFRILPTVAESP